jgi:beta-N-acetylhexosaminidase
MVKKISLSKLSLDEKIGQMVIVKGGIFEQEFLKLFIGGIFFSSSRELVGSEKEYKKLILKWQENSKIKLFVSGDVEGYWNPLKFYNGKIFGDIKNKKEAFDLGKEQGEIMRKLGFNINFSPICEIKNNVWPGRSFEGSQEEIRGKIINYIKGLHSEKILATAKHYPGGSMVKDPHKISFKARTSKEELSLFDSAIKNDVKAIMIGHPIAYGVIDSNNKPSTLSKELILNLRKKFNGIIITDGISMQGLSSFYKGKGLYKSYPDLVSAGNDIILDITPSKGYGNRIRKGINEIKKEIVNGNISEKQINDSVKRILKLKGYQVIN